MCLVVALVEGGIITGMSECLKKAPLSDPQTHNVSAIYPRRSMSVALSLLSSHCIHLWHSIALRGLCHPPCHPPCHPQSYVTVVCSDQTGVQSPPASPTNLDLQPRCHHPHRFLRQGPQPRQLRHRRGCCCHRGGVRHRDPRQGG